MRHVLLAMATALACLAAAPPAAARPFGVEDLLSQETIGAAVLDPGGRWLVFEQRDPYSSARRYDYDQSVNLTLGRLRVVETRTAAPARPLLADDPLGVVIGAFSPSGDRMAVFRLQDRTWRLGVVTLSTGAVRWFPITPDDAGRGRSLQWIDDHQLLVIDRPDGSLPRTLRRGWTMAAQLPPLWEASATGLGAHTAYGSGRYLGARERRAPNRLLRLDVETGEQQVLAGGQFIDLELSPGRRQVALLESGPDLQPRPDEPVRGPAGSETEASRLAILDLGTGDRRAPCPSCDVSPNLLSWSPSGRRLLTFVRGPDGLWTGGHLQIVDGRTGSTTPIGSDVRPRLETNPVSVWTDWMGDDPLIYGRARVATAERDDWFRITAGGARNLTGGLAPPSPSARLADGTSLRVLAGGALWHVWGDGRQRRILKATTSVSLQDQRFGDGTRLSRLAGPTLWVSTPASDGRRTLIGLDAKGRRTTLPDVPAGSWGDAVAGGGAVVRTTDPRGVTGLALVTPARATTVAQVNRAWSGIDPPQIIPVRHVGPAGQPLTSWVFLPAQSVARVPAPLIVRPYLGSQYPTPPGDAAGMIQAYENLRVLTGRGYAVLVPSLPNPPGGMRDPSLGLADRILDIVRWAVETPDVAGRIDPDRAALMGFSFGGYSVMQAITQTDCFKAAVAMDGISDMTAYWSALPAHLQLQSDLAYWSNWSTGTVEQTQPELQVPPWADPGLYVRNSPLMAADRISTPLLLIHGAQDGLPVAQSEAMYSALFRQSKDALLLIYWGAMHVPRSPGDIRSVYDETFRFLDDHLGPPITTGAPSESLEPGSANVSPRPPPPPRTGCPSASRAR